jgi:hypothetical protein
MFGGVEKHHFGVELLAGWLLAQSVAQSQQQHQQRAGGVKQLLNLQSRTGCGPGA